MVPYFRTYIRRQTFITGFSNDIELYYLANRLYWDNISFIKGLTYVSVKKD